MAPDLTGRLFGRLVVIKRGPNGGRYARWWCRCKCGSETLVRAGHLISHNTSSCGCSKRDTNLKHGYARHASQHPLYWTWRRMIERCENPKHDNYRYYGARGIKVCARWRHSFPTFLADIGERPPATTLDRIDNDGPYEPGNVRWADGSTQRLNRRRKCPTP